MVDKEPPIQTVGEKLLKEPIWIGMIVIVNLVLFFCLSYIIRRNCGQRISDMIPSRNKSTTIEISKESKTESPSLDRSVYPTYIESPMISTITRSKAPKLSLPKQQDDTDQPSSTNISIPTTPIINDYNREAALKLFAAYNTEIQLDPSLTQINTDRKRLTSECREDFMTCGFQGGTISFSDDEDIPKDTKYPNLSTNSLVRSKSSDIPTFEEYKKKVKRVFTNPERGSPNFPNSNGGGNNVHCYPEIRIVNEFNEECNKNTDSDQTMMDSSDRGLSSSKSLCNEELHLSNNLERMDSGYPSTSTVSSNNTQCTAPQDCVKTRHELLSASDRRKQFSSKAKSTSFYKLSATTLDSDNYDVSVNYTTFRESKQNHEKRRLESGHKHFRSYEVNPVCMNCTDRFKTGVNSFSCDNDLDKIRRYDSVTRCCTKHDCGRRKHQRRPKCCYHRHKYCDSDHAPRHSNSRYIPKYTSPTSRYLSLSEIRDIRRNHKRALARLSSTESEGCTNEAESCHRRRAYLAKEHYSDGCVPCMANRRHLSPQEWSPNWNAYMNDPFKSQMMQSFLSDTYNCNVNDAETMATCASVEGATTENHLLSPQQSINDSSTNVFKTSLDSSKSVSPNPELSDTNNIAMLSKNNMAVENMPRTVLDSACDKLKDVVRSKVRACDSVSSLMKDSAYQTKQSSVDVFTASQPLVDIIDTIEAITESCPEDRESAESIRRYLQQAALKLALLKRLQGPKQESKDSAIQTFSEDDVSMEDEPRKSYTKRSGAFLAMQMKELKLSQVKEEHSTCSKETDCYNTPNNEQYTEPADRSGSEKVIETSIINSVTGILCDDHVAFQETIV